MSRRFQVRYLLVCALLTFVVAVVLTVGSLSRPEVRVLVRGAEPGIDSIQWVTVDALGLRLLGSAGFVVAFASLAVVLAARARLLATRSETQGKLWLRPNWENFVLAVGAILIGVLPPLLDEVAGLILLDRPIAASAVLSPMNNFFWILIVTGVAYAVVLVHQRRGAAMGKKGPATEESASTSTRDTPAIG